MSSPGNKAGSKTVAAVVVTRNRLQLLKECIGAVRNQTHSPDEIIVIDNDSDDGTREWLLEQGGLTVIRQGNLGGAGGFYTGIKVAYERGHAWFWCMDDDTIPAPDCLERLVAAPYFDDPRTGFLGSIVKWTDGSLHKMNVHGTARRVDWYRTVVADKCVPVITSSFVSILISRAAVAKEGLPLKEFFIWYDDVEYTYRISKHFNNYYVLDSIAVHKTAANKDADIRGLNPADYNKLHYGLRNQIVLLKLQDHNPVRRSARVGFHILRNSFLVLRRRAPLSLVFSMLSGLFFSPKIYKPAINPAINKDTNNL